jgi:sortase A
MSRREAIQFVVVRSLGNFLLLFALYGVAATFGPALYYELQFRVIEARGIHFSVRISDVGFQRAQKKDTKKQSLSESQVKEQTVQNFQSSESSNTTGNPGFAQILAGSKEQELIPKDTNFSIVIPKIGASATIYPNVDPNNPEEFLPILAKGIAHAKGSVFPGMKGNVYLFAHSTDNWWNVGRYNAVFYLLKDLQAGDEIVIFFENQRYEYKVAYTTVADPTDVGYLTASHAGESRLVMQTCWPPGTTWKRLYVIARPVSSVISY